MCRLCWNLGTSTSWNPLGLSRPVMGLLYLYAPYCRITGEKFMLCPRQSKCYATVNVGIHLAERVAVCKHTECCWLDINSGGTLARIYLLYLVNVCANIYWAIYTVCVKFLCPIFSPVIQLPFVSKVFCISHTDLCTFSLHSFIIATKPLSHALQSYGKEQDNTQKHKAGTAFNPLTLILLTWRIWWAPANVSKWQMGFNSEFKGLNAELNPICHLLALLEAHHIFHVSGLRVKQKYFPCY